MALMLRDLLSPDSQLYAKSEFEPASNQWPALAFSSNKIASDFQAESRRGRDFVFFVGTSNPVDTPDPRHRQRVMSVVDVEPRAIVQTQTIVSPASWERAQLQHPGRWGFALRLARAWEIPSLPRAHNVLPLTYAKFSNPGTRGHPIPVEPSDIPYLSNLELVPLVLDATERSDVILNLNVSDADLRKELSRVATNIQNAINRSLQERTGVYPMRGGPNYSDIYTSLSKAWSIQDGKCNLCGGDIPLISGNKLLKMSPDRIESTNKFYRAENLHITHFGCNLAKNDANAEQWAEFLAMLRK